MTVDTTRKEGVRAITVSPEWWAADACGVARTIAMEMEKRPAAVWVIAIGENDPAGRLMDQLFMYGPAEEPLDKDD